MPTEYRQKSTDLKDLYAQKRSITGKVNTRAMDERNKGTNLKM